jgi:hypothetical protein
VLGATSGLVLRHHVSHSVPVPGHVEIETPVGTGGEMAGT